AAVVDEARVSAHENEVAGREAGPAARNAGDHSRERADHFAGLVAGVGVATPRAQPYFDDQVVGIERLAQPVGEPGVDDTFGDQDPGAVDVARAQRHRLGRPPVWFGRTCRVSRVVRAA